MAANGPYLREAQWEARELIPNSGLICTNDLVEPYEATNIHPKNKREVGHRLAYMALNKTYGFSDIACKRITGWRSPANWMRRPGSCS